MTFIMNFGIGSTRSHFISSVTASWPHFLVVATCQIQCLKLAKRDSRKAHVVDFEISKSM